MRIPRAPERYEPEEVPEDDFDAQDDMPGQDDTVSADSRSTGSLADWVVGDDEIEYLTDPDDPDWEEESEGGTTEEEADE